MYQNLNAASEELLNQWRGKTKDAFITTNQQTIELSEDFMIKVGCIADNTADFEEKMVMTDIRAGEAVGE